MFKKSIAAALLISIAFLSFAVIPVCAEEEEIILEPPAEVEPEKEVIESPAIAPKWEEFCETGYEKVESTERSDVFDIFSFVKSERAKKNYWAARRESFNKYLNYCNTITDETDKGVCYTELRKIETDKNDEYKHQRKELLYQHNIRIDK